MWEETFSKRGNVTSFVGQTKKESVTSIMGWREYYLLFYKYYCYYFFYLNIIKFKINSCQQTILINNFYFFQVVPK